MNNKDTEPSTMRITEEAVEGNLKKTMSQPAKKLKQARLPFQILSPADKLVGKKTRKRKASTACDDVKIKEVSLDVKENQILPDKKSRLELKDETKQRVIKEKHICDNSNSKIVLNEVIEIDDDSVENISDQGENVKVEEKHKESDDNLCYQENIREKTVESEEIAVQEGKEFALQDETIDEGRKTSLDTSITSQIDNSSCEILKNSSEKDSPAVTTSTMTPLITPESSDTKSLSPPNTTPKQRKLTPKQLFLKKERERIRKEKERMKEEKERQKAEEKEEKLRLKNEKEDAKRREKEEKEKKKQAEIEAKIEEKRLKEEEKKAKEEERKRREEAKEDERKKRDEEKKQREEEKRLKEEAKSAEHRKSAAVFASFFVPKKIDFKSQPVEENVVDTPETAKFMPFEVKGDMRLAPLVRREFANENKELLDSCLENQSHVSDTLYIQLLKTGKYVSSSYGKTWPEAIDEDDDIIIVEAENQEEGSKEVKEEKEGKTLSRRPRAKLIQFHENRRPPYWGTWRKKSLEIRPRAPLNKDKTMIEYEVDSDDEWEEDEDGESLRGSDDEESQDENYEEDNEMFVPHGYLSEEEGQDEIEDTSPEAQKAKLKLLQLEFEAERNEKQERQKPRLIGCVWFRNSDDNPEKVGSQIAELFLPRRAVWENDLPISLKIESPISKEDFSLFELSRKRTVPESVIPKMISLLHGNCHKARFLSEELYHCFINDKVEPNPSRRSISTKIRELATWMMCPIEEGPPLAKRKCWYVKEDIRGAYGLKDLKASQSLKWNYSLTPKQKHLGLSAEFTDSPVQSPQLPSPSITRFTKILSPEERQRQLLINAVDSTPADKPVLKSKKRSSSLSDPPGQELSTKNKAGLLEKFIKSKSQSDQQNVKGNLQTMKIVQKRITPISLPRTKALQETNDDCIVLSD